MDRLAGVFLRKPRAHEERRPRAVHDLHRGTAVAEALGERWGPVVAQAPRVYWDPDVDLARRARRSSANPQEPYLRIRAPLRDALGARRRGELRDPLRPLDELERLRGVFPALRPRRLFCPDWRSRLARALVDSEYRPFGGGAMFSPARRRFERMIAAP